MICCEGDCEQGRDCPLRKELQMDKQWALGLVSGVVMTSLIAIGIGKMKTQHDIVASVDMPRDIITAYNQGLKDALKTNPPSMDLEQTCVNMWADKQPVR